MQPRLALTTDRILSASRAAVGYPGNRSHLHCLQTSRDLRLSHGLSLLMPPYCIDWLYILVLLLLCSMCVLLWNKGISLRIRFIASQFLSGYVV
jgi:hypothetical protein